MRELQSQWRRPSAGGFQSSLMPPPALPPAPDDDAAAAGAAPCFDCGLLCGKWLVLGVDPAPTGMASLTVPVRAMDSQAIWATRNTWPMSGRSSGWGVIIQAIRDWSWKGRREDRGRARARAVENSTGERERERNTGGGQPQKK